MFDIDKLEDSVFQASSELLDILLIDQTRSNDGCLHNIFWATSDYESLGNGYEYDSPILPQLITGDKSNVIKPRFRKDSDSLVDRMQEMAEVFTPSWICNLQNNAVDERWFGRKDVFNRAYEDEHGVHHWEAITDLIQFPEGKTWKDYVLATQLEISCGEAPYLISRYDAVTGELIPIEQRIGLLDRKLRIVGENTDTADDWFEWGKEAYKSTYAYEWQGDNLLIARKSMLLSFIEYYQHKFSEQPSLDRIKSVAHIISWNVWQMDGLKGVIPKSCGKQPEFTISDLFGCSEDSYECEGCKTNNIREHNGIYCMVKDWQASPQKTGKKGKTVRFIDLMEH